MYIVIETHGGAEYATIVMNEDGTNRIFDQKVNAEQEAENCQCGIVVEI